MRSYMNILSILSLIGLSRAMPDLGREIGKLPRHCYMDKGNHISISKENLQQNAQPECGRPEIRPTNVPNPMLIRYPLPEKIVGGYNATPYSWPWQASLQTNNNHHVCGGALIHKEWILTAGHCLFEPNTYVPRFQSFKIVLGIYNTSSKADEQAKQEFNIRLNAVHDHPGFVYTEYYEWFESTLTNLDYDFALIRLPRPAKLRKEVSLVCLPKPSPWATLHKKLTMTGWGDTLPDIDKSTPSRILKQVTLPVVKNKQLPATHVPAIMSYGFMEGLGGGDSGGPSVAQNRCGKWFLYGINSAGSNTTSVSAKVQSVCDWIKETSGVDCIDDAW